jgi:hypothetical protein
MADEESELQRRINEAAKSLKGAFGEEFNLEGQGADRFLDINSLAEVYKEEASRDLVSKQFLTMAKSIRAMRSSFLPVDFFINPIIGGFNAEIANTIAETESYENAFMRMLGMPSVGTSDIGLNVEDIEIRSAESLIMVDPFSGEQSKVSFEEVREKILTQRQRARKSRRIVVDNTIYNIFADTESAPEIISIRSLPIESVAELLSVTIDPTGQQLIAPSGPLSAVNDLVPPPVELTKSEGTLTEYDNPLIEDQTIPLSAIESVLEEASEGETQALISNLSKDFWKFSYLLIPPIQNVEISRCINEPEKIVSSPFTNRRTNTINNSKIRPTLLESIIRIRLDRVSGTDTQFVPPVEESTTGIKIEINLGTDKEEELEVNTNSYGILESLFILRLRSAISGLAQKMMTDIDIIIKEIEKTGRVPISEDGETGAEIPSESNEAGNQHKDLGAQIRNNILEVEIEKRRQQKLIEDSILILLGDNSETLDLQAQTQRSSSMLDAHMMSGLIGIIDIPRKRLEKEIADIQKKKEDETCRTIDQKTKEIGVVLGTDVGIGTLDLAVFSLALFTMKEKSLLGLLSTAQFDRLKNGEFSSLLPEEGEKEDSLIAINELSQLVIDGYKTFIKELEDDKRPGN